MAPNINNMGWDMVANSLFEALTLVSTYELPIHITEFGTCGALDKRKGFLDQHLRYSMNCIERALGNNIDVCAALWWTLLDNWEWEDDEKTNKDRGEGFGLYSWDGKAKASLVKLFMCMTSKISAVDHTSKSYIF